MDVIIFGASGYAGKHTVREAVNVLKKLRWGVAGRSRRKLQAVLDEIGTKTEIDPKGIPIIVAQINDYRSLAAMAQKCRIVVNCCGPYGLYGEAVVKACIEAGTHYVDINTEPEYMKMIQLKYDAQAKENSVYVVCACGFPSMAVDVGVNFIRNNFKGTLNFIDAYTEFCDEGSEFFDPVASAAVWASLVLALSKNKEIPAIRNSLFKKLWSDLSPKPSERAPTFHQSAVVRGVCVPFPLIAPQVVASSQYYFNKQYNIRPIQFRNYLAFPSVIFASIFLVWCFLITFLAQFRCTRNFLIRHPAFFSFGLCSPSGPSEEKMEKVFFRITFAAVGWSEVENQDNTFLEPEDKALVAKVSGLNPLYGAACVALLTSAVTILREKHKMPGSGGVLTPGAAFARTNIISELESEEHGMVFDITQE